MRLIVTLVLFVISLGLSAQNVSVPEPNFNAPADYTAQNDKAVELIDFLHDTPADEMNPVRKRAGAYLLTWLTGSPDVSIELGNLIAPFMAYGNGGALLASMGGYAKHSLQHPGADPAQSNAAAVSSVIDFYTLNRGAYGKNKEIAKLIKLRDKGKLEAYIAKKK